MQLFGCFLVERGRASPEEVLRALERQRSSQTPVGKLALTTKMMRVKEVFQVLNEQLDSGMRFGEQAVGLGFISPEQCRSLLDEQRNTRPPIGEILVEMGVLDSQTLEAELREFAQVGLSGSRAESGQAGGAAESASGDRCATSRR